MNMRSRVCLRPLLLLSLVAAGSAAAGCSSTEDDSVFSDVGVINRSGSALVGEVKSIDGVYGPSCAGHAENEAWSAAVDGDATLTNAPLRVSA